VFVGRTDDLIKVNGHRIGTAEIEGAVVAHPAGILSAACPAPAAASVTTVSQNSEVCQPGFTT
jgi:acyl-coenzyme A synthetase/AMP-(fatty) acid ligase